MCSKPVLCWPFSYQITAMLRWRLFSVWPTRISRCSVPTPSGQQLRKPHISPAWALWLGLDETHSAASPNSIPYMRTLHIFKIQTTCFLQPEIFTDTIKQNIVLPSCCWPCLHATRTPYVTQCFATSLLMCLYFAVLLLGGSGTSFPTCAACVVAVQSILLGWTCSYK